MSLDWKWVVGTVVAVAGVVAGTGALTNDAPSIDTIDVANSANLVSKDGSELLYSANPEMLSLVANAKDSEGQDKLSYSWKVEEVLSDGSLREVDTSSGQTINFTPSKTGAFNIRSLVSDGGFFGLSPKSDTQLFSLTVVEPDKPIAQMTLSNSRVSLGEVINLDGRSSTFQKGVAAPRYFWSVSSDGRVQNIGRGSQLTFTPNAPGEYSVQLRIVDQYSAESSATQTLVVDLPELPRASIRAERLKVTMNEDVRLSGTPSDSRYSLKWSIGSDPAVMGTSDSYVFSSSEPGVFRLNYRIADQWQEGVPAVQPIEVLQARNLSADNMQEVNGVRVFDYSGTELVLVGQIKTNGVPTTFKAHTIRSDSAVITAFSTTATSGGNGANGNPGPDGKRNGAIGGDGVDGVTGRAGISGSAAGLIRIEAQRLVGSLTVNANGQPGGNGGAGGNGGKGGMGHRGNNGSSNVLDCGRGPQSGGNGGAGGNAGSGGNGGDGGAAASVVIVLGEVDSDARLSISATGGTGGAPGSAGTPGKGGSGGKRGAAPGICTQTAKNGSTGSPGSRGVDGASGIVGLPGTIELIIGDGPVKTATGNLSFP